MYKIVMVGRPNVGKSTLFNRLIRSNRAITHDRPGITRDRMEGTVRNKFHRPFILVDTGGITLDSHAHVTEGPKGIRGFEAEILRQAEDAISEACGICFVVDAKDGLTPFDDHLAAYLRRLGKPLLLVVNKVDGMEREDVLCADFHILGFEMVAVSAEHGNQIRFLESLMADMLPEIPDTDEEDVMNASNDEEKTNDRKYGKHAKSDATKEKIDKKNKKSDEKFSMESDEQDEQDEQESPDAFLMDFDSSDAIDDGEFSLDILDTVNDTGEMGIINDTDDTDDTESDTPDIFSNEPSGKMKKDKENVLKICLLGRPNAGKSSILNAFVGSNRMIVSEEAGTTRDSVDVPIIWEGRKYVFVDTAGVRRRTKISDTVERYSVNSSIKSTTKAHVTFIVIDALQGLTAQDKRLIELLDEHKTPFLIILNKMDLVPASARKGLQKQFSEALAFCQHVPVMSTSARSRYGLKMLLPMAEQIKRECSVRIGTGQLNRAMESVLTKHQPPVVRRVRPKFYYLTQAESQPPTFVFFVNDAERIVDSYLRYLEKSLRRIFAIEHAPMRVHLRSSHTKNSERRSPKKTKIDSALMDNESVQYVDQRPEIKKEVEKENPKAEKRAPGKAKAKGGGRTTLKAALRNPSSPQSRTLKKALRKKKK